MQPHNHIVECQYCRQRFVVPDTRHPLAPHRDPALGRRCPGVHGAGRPVATIGTGPLWERVPHNWYPGRG
jgi:hypothetical protein